MITSQETNTTKTTQKIIKITYSIFMENIFIINKIIYRNYRIL